jgi:hypothetical protein
VLASSKKLKKEYLKQPEGKVRRTMKRKEKIIESPPFLRLPFFYCWCVNPVVAGADGS